MAGALRVDVNLSGIWQMSSTLLSAEGECLLIDPGYFPSEFDKLARLTRERGELVGLVYTHAHWDHVLGHLFFAEVELLVSEVLARGIAAGAPWTQDALAEAERWDAEWYVERPGEYVWPERVGALGDEERLAFGGQELTALALPGHSWDSLALYSAAEALLICGDYLSPCEIPFVDDLAAYQKTLTRLVDLLAQGVRRVIPGHGPALTAAQAQTIAQADLIYLDAIAAAATHNDAQAALAVPLPRAANRPQMAEHHRDNCCKAGLVLDGA